MEIRVLKISNNKRKEQGMSGLEVLDIHFKQFERKGKVTYSTGVPINRKPKKVVLTMGNIVDKLYLCEIDDHDYKGKGILFKSAKPNIVNNTPSMFKSEENVSWLLIKSMKEISINYFSDECTQEAMRNFIKSRANNKTLNTNQDL